MRNISGDHNEETCVRSRVCGINNCKNIHNRLLHRDSASADRSEQGASHDRLEMEQGASGGSQTVAESETSNEMSLTTERSHSKVTSQNAQRIVVALRTVPVFLKSGNKRIKANALLDEASAKMYF